MRKCKLNCKCKTKAGVEREMTVMERIERLERMALRAKGVYDENISMDTKMTDKEAEARLICFSCLDKEFNKIGKKMPDGTSTCRKGKCDYCNKANVSVLSANRFL